MKIVLAAVMHSPNLGDGIIAACIDAAARRLDPDIDLHWLDLAGRTTTAGPGGHLNLRTGVLTLLDTLPQTLGQSLARRLVAMQVRRRLDPLLPAAFAGARGVIIGGGQLLSDVHLNFPVKIARIVAEAEARDLPIALHGVGVAQHWTRAGTALFQRLLDSPNLRFVSVRDAASRDHLDAHLNGMGLTRHLCAPIHPDPGLMAADLVPQHAAAGHLRRPRIGLGITHPVAVRTHAPGVARTPHRDWVAWYRAVATDLGRDHEVILFTNGSPEDEAMLDDVAVDRLPATRLPRCHDPRDLVAFIAGLDGLAAHRLHALIVGHALGVPVIGFRWDPKVDAFFTLAGRTAYLLDALRDAPSNVSARLDAARADPAPPDQLEQLSDAARAGVRAALNALR